MFKDILIPVNMSDEATWKEPLAIALGFAQRFGARLHLISVVPSFDYPIVESFFPVDFEQKAREKVHAQLHQFVADHIPQGVQAQIIVAAGSIYEEILETAKTINCDLIIMTRKGGPRQHFLIGSNAERVMHHAKTPVLIVS